MSLLKRGLFIFKSYVSPILDKYDDALRKDDGHRRKKSMEELERELEADKRRRSKAGRKTRHQQAPRDPKLAQCYANLELPFGANLEQVKKAWRRLMKKYHPDRYLADPRKQKLATELSQKITHSYEVLEEYLIEKKKNGKGP